MTFNDLQTKPEMIITIKNEDRTDLCKIKVCVKITTKCDKIKVLRMEADAKKKLDPSGVTKKQTNSFVFSFFLPLMSISEYQRCPIVSYAQKYNGHLERLASASTFSEKKKEHLSAALSSLSLADREELFSIFNSCKSCIL
eukprot:GHVP01009238.1.p1 GENE.GHVP01009238.1~~GHVP01009238.1.p1  ORF type:complete len:141 (+),score=16.70 GHVP01009238.1:575-997(+)